MQRPFKLQSYEKNKKVVISKNDFYYDSNNVKLGGANFWIFPNSEKCIEAFNAGVLDAAVSLMPSDLKNGNFDKETLQIAPVFSSQHILINNEIKPFNDVIVRRALALAIDRDYLINEILFEPAQPAYALVPYGYGLTNKKDFRDGRKRNGISNHANIERAKKLLTDAGFPDGKGFPVIKISCLDDSREEITSRGLAMMWKKSLNINCEIVSQNAADLYNSASKGEFEVLPIVKNTDYLHPMAFLSDYTSYQDLNFSRYANAKFDELIKTYNLEEDRQKSDEILMEVEDTLMMDMPTIPLYYGSRCYLVSKRVKGSYLTPIGKFYLKNIYIENRKRSHWVS